ncbi:hypothetical protein BWI97_14220 [Siphonobacter sp. BAB-5405]|nr:hypothetical protein BWI97_14220 [Siphonobacter sp. BAB-5405]
MEAPVEKPKPSDKSSFGQTAIGLIVGAVLTYLVQVPLDKARHADSELTEKVNSQEIRIGVLERTNVRVDVQIGHLGTSLEKIDGKLEELLLENRKSKK